MGPDKSHRVQSPSAWIEVFHDWKSKVSMFDSTSDSLNVEGIQTLMARTGWRLRYEYHRYYRRHTIWRKDLLQNSVVHCRETGERLINMRVILVHLLRYLF